MKTNMGVTNVRVLVLTIKQGVLSDIKVNLP